MSGHVIWQDSTHVFWQNAAHVLWGAQRLNGYMPIYYSTKIVRQWATSPIK